MEMKNAAEELLKIADDLENEAAAVTQFVCEGCNHTATLEIINTKRVEAAQNSGQEVVVAKIDVEDVISCPACGGRMSYQPTEESQKYYINVKADDDDDDDDDKGDKKASTPIDYDSLKRYSA